MSITRFRGDTKPIVVTLLTITDSIKSPINLTGCTNFKLTADPSKTPTDDTKNIFSIAGTVLSPTNGTVEFLLSESDAEHLGIYYFDVQFFDSRGFRCTAGKEKLTFEQDITKT